MTLTPTTIDGAGVRLRPWAAKDIASLPLACTDPQTNRFLTLPDPYTESDAHWWVHEGAPAAWSAGGTAFAVVDPQTDDLLGGTGFSHPIPGRGQAEVGYWVAPWARGRGVAVAAVGALSNWAFEQGFARLEVLAVKENVASLRVALGAGFTREGVRRDAGLDRHGVRHDLVAFARLTGDPAGPAPRALPDFPDGRLTDGVATLRPIGRDDADDYYALNQFPEVQRTNVGPLVTVESARQRCAQAAEGWLGGQRADCSIVDADTGAWAGDITLVYRDPFLKQAMIGYALHPDFRGRGFATRAAVLISDWAFEIGVLRVIAGTRPDNEASQRVLTRAGFSQEGYLKAFLPERDGSRIDDIQFVRISPLLNPAL